MTPTSRTELAVDGMTCAACARRVERKLNDLDGVSATVNFATARASIEFDPELAHAEHFDHAVTSAGYTPVREHDGDDHGAHHHDHSAYDGERAVLALLIATPVFLTGMFHSLHFVGWEWVQLVLATVVVGWAAFPIHRAAARNLRHGGVGMDTLVSLGVLSAWIWSVVELARWNAETGLATSYGNLDHHAAPLLHFESAAVVSALVLLGRWMEGRGRREAGEAVHAVLSLAAPDAQRWDTDTRTETTVASSNLQPGDVVVVRPGGRIPSDGEVLEGHSSVDQSLVSGESLPVEVAPGDAVTGATINTTGRLLVRITRVGSDTTLASIARMVERAQTGTTQAQRLADRVSGIFVPIVLALAAATLGGWLLAGIETADALERAIAVLVVACPCALGLATPVALLAGTGRGAQLGMLIAGPQALELTHDIDAIVLDKTGTLTEARMQVTRVAATAGVTREDVERFAAAVEHGSEHPIAAAIVSNARERSIDVPTSSGFTAVPGLGAHAITDADADEVRVLVGREPLFDAEGWAIPDELAVQAAEDRVSGATAVFVGWDGAVRGVIAVADTVRPEARAAVDALRALGIRPIMVTGDAQGVAEHVAAQLGIDEVHADALPNDKAAIVEELRRTGATVAVLGDGINDAPALAAAHLGIAMGSGTDAAIAAGDITLLGSDPRDAARAISLARRTLGIIRSNLFWAFAYNVAAIPLAVAGVLSPMIAGGAMAASSVFVVGNSLRLRRYTPD